MLEQLINHNPDLEYNNRMNQFIPPDLFLNDVALRYNYDATKY